VDQYVPGNVGLDHSRLILQVVDDFRSGARWQMILFISFSSDSD